MASCQHWPRVVQTKQTPARSGQQLTGFSLQFVLEAQKTSTARCYDTGNAVVEWRRSMSGYANQHKESPAYEAGGNAGGANGGNSFLAARRPYPDWLTNRNPLVRRNGCAVRVADSPNERERLDRLCPQHYPKPASAGAVCGRCTNSRVSAAPASPLKGCPQRKGPACAGWWTRQAGTIANG